MTPAAAGGALTWPDYAVLFVALAGLLLIGGAFTREQRDTSDFFLARRRVPWCEWPLSVVLEFKLGSG